MAFPSGYTKYQEITIASSQVDANLTDYPVYVDLSDLVKAGDDIFDTCRTDGGDIRVTKSDGTTELAREVVEIDTTAKTGEMHIKFTGTLSSTVDTVIRVYYNGTDTEPARTATYGSDNVWTDYDLVVHGQIAGEDSSANDFADVANGNLPTTATGKVGGAQSFDGTGDYYDFGDQTAFDIDDAGGIDKTIQTWFKKDVRAVEDAVAGKWGATSSQRNWLFRNESSGKMRMFLGSGGTTGQNVQGTTVVGAGTWGMVHFTWDASENDGSIYTNGADKQTNTSMTTVSASTAKLGWGTEEGAGGGSSAGQWDGLLDEFRIRSSILSDTWISTEYSNQNSPSTFYSTSDEEGGSTASSFPDLRLAFI